MRGASHTWSPSFCPNPECIFHLNPQGWHFKRIGFYARRCAPRRIQRYRCSRCRRSFSSQTFSPTYWLKRPDLLAPIYAGLLSCAAYRQIARFRGLSPSTVMGQAERLGRHCLLLLQQLRPRGAPCEPLVVDGFESFEFSQYFPLHVNIAVGAHSHFVYAFTDAELRRKGRMTKTQKRKRALLEARLGRPDPRAVENEVAALIELVAPQGGFLEIRSDEHPAYPRALRRVRSVEARHRTTSSRAARRTSNPLFPVNRVDLLARHCGANHKRETIAYSKRRQSVMERFAVFAAWLNFQKSFSEKRKDRTPGERLGLLSRPLTTDQLLARRLFPSKIRLPARWQRYYDRALATRCIPNGKRHRLRYAY